MERSPCRSAPVGGAGREALCGPGDEGAAAGEQRVGHAPGRCTWGSASWLGKVVAPHLPQLLPISCGFSSGQVEISGASAFCVDTSLTIIGNDVLV